MYLPFQTQIYFDSVIDIILFWFILVLSQVKDFLPLLASANEKLEKDLAFKPLSDFDIENVESDETFVEMVSFPMNLRYRLIVASSVSQYAV